MLTRIIPILILLSAFLMPANAGPAEAAGCQFVLGFKTLHDLLPAQVGDCAVDEHHNPVNGDGLQETSKGLMAWRKADNWTAFTDGYRTWVNGPAGLAERLNTERFSWEGDAAGFPRPPVSQAPGPAEPGAGSGSGLAAGGGAVVDTDTLTLRGGPGQGNPAVGTLVQGATVRLLAGPVNGVWWRVTDGGKVGYVNGTYLAPGVAIQDSAGFDLDLPLTFHRQRTSIWCDPADLQTWTEFVTGKSLGDEYAVQQQLWDWELSHNAGFTMEQWDASPYAIASAANQWMPGRGFNHFTYTDPMAAVNTAAWLISNPKYREPSLAVIWRGDHYILIRGIRATADPFKDPNAKVLGVYVMDPNLGKPSWLGEDRYIPIGEWLGLHFTPVTYLTPGSGVPGDVWQNKYVMVQRDWTTSAPTLAGRAGASPRSYGATDR